MSVRLVRGHTKYYYELEGEVLVVEEYKDEELPPKILSPSEFDPKYRDYAIKAIKDLNSRWVSRINDDLSDTNLLDTMQSISTGIRVKSDGIYSFHTVVYDRGIDDESLDELKVFIEDELSVGVGDYLFNTPIYKDDEKEVFMYLWNSNNFELEYIN